MFRRRVVRVGQEVPATVVGEAPLRRLRGKGSRSARLRRDSGAGNPFAVAKPAGWAYSAELRLRLATTSGARAAGGTGQPVVFSRRRGVIYSRRIVSRAAWCGKSCSSAPAGGPVTTGSLIMGR